MQKQLILTEREQEIFAYLAHGKTNKEIARLLNLSARTIEGHVSHILSKLKARSRTEAAALYYRYTQRLSQS